MVAIEPIPPSRKKLCLKKRWVASLTRRGTIRIGWRSLALGPHWTELPQRDNALEAWRAVRVDAHRANLGRFPPRGKTIQRQHALSVRKPKPARSLVRT